MLGDAQWQWFENELQNSSAQIHIIGSSIQVQSHEVALLIRSRLRTQMRMQHALFAADNAHLSS
jgi:phosphodiesterase/alkaline phosphatase D-like protein